MSLPAVGTQLLVTAVAFAGVDAVGRAVWRRFGGLPVAAVGGVAAGLVWGGLLASAGQTGEPASMKIAGWAGTAAMALSLTAWRRIGQAAVPRLWPWRWSMLQWHTFATLNSSVALGICLGYY